jgi:hypothetical protein
VWKERGLLQYKTNFAPKLHGIACIHFLIKDLDLSRIGRDQAIDYFEDGGLAAARRADNGTGFSRSYLQVNGG